MKRNIYDELLNWKNNNVLMPLMVIGARQIGKTYTIKQFCENEFENMIYINLYQDTEIIKIFSESISTAQKYHKLELYLNKSIDLENTILFIDEIQESEELISALKYFNEDERPFKIICAGSLLGVKVNRMKSPFPVGKVKTIYMYPMNFEEFLYAANQEMLIEEIKKCFNDMTPMDNIFHERLLNLYRIYECVGGMPECVKNIIKEDLDVLKYDSSLIKNIINDYKKDMKRYIQNSSEALKIEQVYNNLPTQLGNPSNKYQITKLGKNYKLRDFASSLNWLLSSRLVLKTSMLDNAQIPPKAYVKDNVFKLYLSDIGILTSLLDLQYNDILLDRDFIYKGIIAENYVAEEFTTRKIPLYYYQNQYKTEIDFILYNNDGLIPVEVKSSGNVSSKSLTNYIKQYNPKYAYRISAKNFGYDGKIKSIPLYAVFLIN